jgi:hypothetical protein
LKVPIVQIKEKAMKVTIDFKNVQEDTLTEVIIALEHARGCQIDCQQSYVLDCPDQTAAAILQTLFGGNGTQPIATNKKVEKKKLEKKPKKVKAEKKHRTDVRYEILSGPLFGKLLTGGALGGMLKAGNLAAGTALSHPERGKLIVVTNGAGIYTLQAVQA